MPKLATPLTDIQVKNAKPKDKNYTLADGGSRYLEVAASGSKTWRMGLPAAEWQEHPAHLWHLSRGVAVIRSAEARQGKDDKGGRDRSGAG
ncbi:MAG: hypothetical protein HHJ12_15290 [Glaciimonas sp.]|nr:hypothetical protein [Glaciimonas sp.]